MLNVADEYLKAHSAHCWREAGC